MRRYIGAFLALFLTFTVLPGMLLPADHPARQGPAGFVPGFVGAAFVLAFVVTGMTALIGVTRATLDRRRPRSPTRGIAAPAPEGSWLSKLKWAAIGFGAFLFLAVPPLRFLASLAWNGFVEVMFSGAHGFERVVVIVGAVVVIALRRAVRRAPALHPVGHKAELATPCRWAYDDLARDLSRGRAGMTPDLRARLREVFLVGLRARGVAEPRLAALQGPDAPWDEAALAQILHDPADLATARHWLADRPPGRREAKTGGAGADDLFRLLTKLRG